MNTEDERILAECEEISRKAHEEADKSLKDSKKVCYDMFKDVNPTHSNWIGEKEFEEQGITNVMGVNGGPVMKLNGITFVTKTYKIDKLQDLKTDTGIKKLLSENSALLIYDPPANVKNIEIWSNWDEPLKKGTKITIQYPDDDVECIKEIVEDGIRIKFDTDNPKKQSYYFRFYSPEPREKQDNFVQCEETKCVIDNVEANLEEIVEEAPKE